MEGMHISNWAPIFVVAGTIFFGGIIWLLYSLRSGQYKDPEAAKFGVLDEDGYPESTTQTERPSTG